MPVSSPSAPRSPLSTRAAFIVIALLTLALPLAEAISALLPGKTGTRYVAVFAGADQGLAALTRAGMQPLSEGLTARIWLAAAENGRSGRDLYAAGALLVLDGDGFLAGCLAPGDGKQRNRIAT